MLCMTLKHHSWELEVEVILSVIVSFINVQWRVDRSKCLGSQCRYNTIWYNESPSSLLYNEVICSLEFCKQFSKSVFQWINSEDFTCIVCTKTESGTSKAVIEDQQQRITDTGVWQFYVHIIIYYHILTISLYDFFCSVSSSSQIGCKIRFNWLVLPELHLTVL